MAARVVTDFTKYIDHGDLIPRKQILATAPDDTLNDQQFCLEVEQCLLTDCFPTEQWTTDGWYTVGYWKINDRDMCGIQATDTDAKAYCYIWINNASLRSVSWRVTTSVGTYTSGAVTATTPTWDGPLTIQIASTGSIETIQLEADRSPLSNTVYCAGLAIYSGS